MKLYLHPASSACRPVLLFAADHGLALEHVFIDILAGDQHSTSFRALNPAGTIPVLDDDGFVLTESSAILKYLADTLGSPSYPRDIRERARVNAVMDWFLASFYPSFGFGLCYPQLPGAFFDGFRAAIPAAQDKTNELAKAKAERHLTLLDDHILGPSRPWLCGESISIADYLASGMVSVGEVIGCTFAAWPNVARWYDRMRAGPHWNAANAGLAAFAEAMRGPDYVRL